MTDEMKEIYGVVNSILILAIINNEILHIDVKYSAYINEIEIKVFSRNTNYLRGHKRKFSCGVYLDNPSALKTLRLLKSELISLIKREQN